MALLSKDGILLYGNANLDELCTEMSFWLLVKPGPCHQKTSDMVRVDGSLGAGLGNSGV